MDAPARHPNPLVTVITAHGGNPLLSHCMASVRDQRYPHVEHLVVADGPARWASAQAALAAVPEHRASVLPLPHSIGNDRWCGHRIYAAATFVAQGDYVAFLDDDNAFAPEHIERCLEVCRHGRSWSYSLRNIVDREHRFICRDNCESLGQWPSVLGPEDFLIDVNCYFLPKELAVRIAPVWYRRFREPGQPEVDRALCHHLKRLAPDFDCSYAYSVDYLAGNSALSVQPAFFLQGNAEMLRRHGGRLPWVKAQPL